MHKKRLNPTIALGIVFLVLSVSVVSAFSLSDFFNGLWNKITGKITGQENNNLVLYLPFNESEGNATYDSSRFGNNGTIYGAVWAQGVIGGALDFNETYLSRFLGNCPVLTAGESITNVQPISVFAWVYPRGINKSIEWPYTPTIISKSIMGVPWTLDIVNQTDGKAALYSQIEYYSPSTLPRMNNTPAESTSTTSIDLDKWHHVGMAYDETGDRKIHLYIDGEEVGYKKQIASQGKRISDAYTALCVGGKYGVATAIFNGIIDEVKIWNKVLTLEEIKKERELINETKYAVANETTNNAENDSDTENNSFYNQPDLLVDTGIEESFVFNMSVCKDASCQQETRTFYIDEDIYLDYNSSVDISGTITILTYPDNTSRHIDLPSQIKAEQIGAYNLDVTAFKQGYKTVNEKVQFEVIEKEVEVQHTEINGEGLVKGETEKAEKKPGLGAIYYIIIVVVIMALVFVLILVVRLMKQKQEFRRRR